MSSTEVMLVIDGRLVQPDRDYEIGFENRTGKMPRAILYYRGRIVSSPWRLTLNAASDEAVTVGRKES